MMRLCKKVVQQDMNRFEKVPSFIDRLLNNEFKLNTAFTLY